MLQKIISGAQSGVDQGALDACIELGFDCGGCAPKGFRYEYGEIPEKYKSFLDEHSSSSYPPRTVENIKNSDATLIIYKEKLSGGTKLTDRKCKELNKPCYKFDIERDDLYTVCDFIHSNSIEVLNVAGPRESSIEDIQNQTKEIISDIIKILYDDETLSEFWEV